MINFNHQKKNKGNNKGFVLLFAIILSSIILLIALGVSDVALKEVTFGTSAVATNDAFFAADTGADCALYNDKSTINNFPFAGPAKAIICANKSITPSFIGTTNNATYSFMMTGLGSTSLGCTKITVFKDKSVTPMKTTIIAKGYNIGDASCNSSSTARVERELHVDY